MAIALAPVAFGAEPDPGGGAGKLISQGYDFLNDGKHVEAVDQFTEALSVDPRSLSAHEGLMWVHLNIGNNDKVLEHADAMRALRMSVGLEAPDPLFAPRLNRRTSTG